MDEFASKSIFVFICMAVNMGGVQAMYIDSSNEEIYPKSTYLVGPWPREQAVLQGKDHVLTCSKHPDAPESDIHWLEFFDGNTSTTIFERKVPVNNDTKYDNFAIENLDENIWNVVIFEMQTSDEGEYGCRLVATGETATAIRSVEVPPKSLRIRDHFGEQPDNGTITFTDGVLGNASCLSVGSRPPVDLIWYLQTDNSSEWTRISDEQSSVNVTVNPDDNDLYDTTSILWWEGNKTFNSGKMKCASAGQEVAPVKEAVVFLDIYYSPAVVVNCNGSGSECVPFTDIDTNYSTNAIDPNEPAKCSTLYLKCYSDANPPVKESDYRFRDFSTEWNQTRFIDGSSAVISMVADHILTCEARNEVGFGSATILAKRIEDDDDDCTCNCVCKDEKTPGDIAATVASCVLAVSNVVTLFFLVYTNH